MDGPHKLRLGPISAAAAGPLYQQIIDAVKREIAAGRLLPDSPLPSFRACCMKHKVALNGCDYLMLGFDHELRRLGYAGNSCQIILDLGARVSPTVLEQRLEQVTTSWSILQARPGGMLLPKWKLPGTSEAKIAVRTHQDDLQLEHRLERVRVFFKVP